RRPKGRIALFHKADRSRIIKTGQLDLLTTGPITKPHYQALFTRRSPTIRSHAKSMLKKL
ncbi:MAG: hypothetical protein WBQ65_10770, partial [Bryobacteraceae bacterium]